MGLIKNLCFAFLLFLSAYESLNSQCTLIPNIPIEDNLSSSHEIVISGAINDDFNTNGICAVRLKFKHTIIGEVKMILTSPAGEQIELIGPGALISNITSFSTWDIFILPNSFPASPDFGFSAQFNNLEPWGQFGSFTGSYYPSNGDLDQLSIGSINGTWTLEITDLSLFNEGVLEYFELIFCDDSGIDCSPCDPLDATILNQDSTYCLGSTDLALDIDITINNSAPNYERYDSTFIIFDEQNSMMYEDMPDLTNYPPGNYQICFFSFESALKDSLPSDTASFTIPTFVDSLSTLGICSKIEEEDCLMVSISEPEGEIELNYNLCPGDSVIIHGNVFKDEGSYSLDVPGIVCDTLYRINLEKSDFDFDILPSSSLVCDSDTIRLRADHPISGTQVRYHWTTLGGIIISNDTLQEIDIAKSGLYKVMIQVDGCVFEDSIEVSSLWEEIEISLTADDLNCNQDTVKIMLLSNTGIANTTWTGPEIVESNLLEATVTKEGVYFALVEDTHGCRSLDSIEVFSDFDLPDFSIGVDHIDCRNDSAMIQILDLDVNETIEWTNPIGFPSQSTSFKTDYLGPLYLESFGENGCIRLDTVLIKDNSYEIDVSVEVDSILCSRRVVVPTTMLNKAEGDIDYEWWYNSTQYSNIESPQIVDSGSFILHVVDSNDCVGSDTFEVRLDTLSPLVMVEDTIITCIEDSVQIEILNHQSDFSYEWNGPILFESTSAKPYIYDDGTYNITVTNKNGCSSTAQIEVVEGVDLPKSTFTIQPIDCFHDTATIVSDSINGLSFLWFGDHVISNPSLDHVQLDSAGKCFVTITNLEDNCRNRYEFDIEDLRTSIDIEINVDDLNCKTDSVIPDVILSETPSSLAWSSDQPIKNTLDLEPTFFNIGKYYLSLIDENGCISEDSIEVLDDYEIPDLIVKVDTITCDIPIPSQVAISLNANKFTWYQNDLPIHFRDSLWTDESGVYKVVVEGSNGCKDSTEINVQIDTIAPQIEFNEVQEITCIDSLVWISLKETNDFDKVWMGTDILTDLGDSILVRNGGLYTVEIKGDNGCLSVDSVSVSDLRVFPIYTLESTMINCYGDGWIGLSDTINAYNVTWDGPQNVSPNTTETNIQIEGKYKLKIESKEGCFLEESIDILKDTLIPQIIDVVFDSITCLRSETNIEVVSSSILDSIVWSGPWGEITTIGKKLESDNGGQHDILLIGNNGCIKDTMIAIPVDTIKPVVEILGDSITCLQSKVVLKVADTTGIKSFIWSGGGLHSDSSSIFTHKAGEYELKVVGYNNCENKFIYELIEDVETPVFALKDTFYLPCNGDSLGLNIEAEGDILFYRWLGDNYLSLDSMPKVISEGRYEVFVAGSNGCYGKDSTYVKQDDRPIGFSLQYDSITCVEPVAFCEIMTDHATDKIIWKLEDGTLIEDVFSISTSDGGIHTVIVENENTCKDSLQFEVVVDTLKPEIGLIYEDHFICDHTLVDIGVNTTHHLDSLILVWKTDDGQIVEESSDGISVNKEGKYVLESMFKSNGCSTSESITIEEEPSSLDSLDVYSNGPLCLGEENGMIQLDSIYGGFGALNVLINEEVIASPFMLDGLGSGFFNVTVIDSFGCRLDTTIILNDGEDFSIELAGDSTLVLGDQTWLTYTISDPTMLVNDVVFYTLDEVLCSDCDSVSVSPEELTQYYVQIVSDDGCIALDSLLIMVQSYDLLQLPDVIKIGSNSGNGFFKVPSHSAIEEVVLCSIYDRWGNIVYNKSRYKPDEVLEGWDGRLNGTAVTPGVYVVVLELNLENGNELRLIADLTVLH